MNVPGCISTSLTVCALLVSSLPVASAQNAPKDQCGRFREGALRACQRVHNRGLTIKNQCAGLSGAERSSCVRAVVKPQVPLRLGRSRIVPLQREIRDQCDGETREEVRACQDGNRIRLREKTRGLGAEYGAQIRRGAKHLSEEATGEVRACRGLRGGSTAQDCVKAVRGRKLSEAEEETGEETGEE